MLQHAQIKELLTAVPFSGDLKKNLHAKSIRQ